MTFLKFIAAAVLMMTAAQAQQLDTSILKNGNTWKYNLATSTDHYYGTDGTYRTYTGTVQFTLDSLTHSGDSLKFRVVRVDTGAAVFNPRILSDDTLPKKTTGFTWYSFYDNAFYPSAPLFASGQAFSPSDSNVAYKGDTVHLIIKSSGFSCVSYFNRNLETVGRTQDNNGISCGNTSEYTNYTLSEFNGLPYSSDSLSPVGIRPFAGYPRIDKTQISLMRKYQVVLDKNGRIYDLKGKKASVIKR